MGRNVSYTYDSSGRLYTAKDANGGTTTFTYDSNNNMKTIKDARGIVYITIDYDNNNMVSQQTMVDGGIYQFRYVLNGSSLTNSQATVTDPRGNIRIVNFNSRTRGLPSRGFAIRLEPHLLFHRTVRGPLYRCSPPR